MKAPSRAMSRSLYGGFIYSYSHWSCHKGFEIYIEVTITSDERIRISQRYIRKSGECNEEPFSLHEFKEHDFSSVNEAFDVGLNHAWAWIDKFR